MTLRWANRMRNHLLLFAVAFAYTTNWLPALGTVRVLRFFSVPLLIMAMTLLLRRGVFKRFPRLHPERLLGLTFTDPPVEAAYKAAFRKKMNNWFSVDHMVQLVVHTAILAYCGLPLRICCLRIVVGVIFYNVNMGPFATIFIGKFFVQAS